jgi:2-C-methyl-D-erythritol 2,4-cyclodiphosphate synthase
MRIGHGYDIHRLETDLSGNGLVLCGLKIPFDKKFIAHSDGDVAIHALIDALLGAAALGDIGQHFPDTDSKYKNADSKILLTLVMGKLKNCNYAVNNIDLTIIAQKPRLASYISHMVETLSGILNISVNDINIKAKTNEHCDSSGREEAIVVFAVVTIKSI